MTTVLHKMEAIRGHQSSWMALMSWEMYCTCSERFKNMHHEGFYLIKHCGLHWRTIWPLMIPPNDVPFWSPLAICNPFLKSNLKNNEKKMKKWWKTIEKITKKLRPEVLRLLEVSFKCDIKFSWKPMRYMR